MERKARQWVHTNSQTTTLAKWANTRKNTFCQGNVCIGVAMGWQNALYMFDNEDGSKVLWICIWHVIWWRGVIHTLLFDFPLPKGHVHCAQTSGVFTQSRHRSQPTTHNGRLARCSVLLGYVDTSLWWVVQEAGGCLVWTSEVVWRMDKCHSHQAPIGVGLRCHGAWTSGTRLMHLSVWVWGGVAHGQVALASCTYQWVRWCGPWTSGTCLRHLSVWVRWRGAWTSGTRLMHLSVWVWGGVAHGQVAFASCTYQCGSEVVWCMDTRLMHLSVRVWGGVVHGQVAFASCTYQCESEVAWCIDKWHLPHAPIGVGLRWCSAWTNSTLLKHLSVWVWGGLAHCLS